MYGVDMSKPGAQEYYNSVFDLIASWGVDYVKVDDISRPYFDHQTEIEAVRQAIDRTGRPIVLSTLSRRDRLSKPPTTSSSTPTSGASAMISGIVGWPCANSFPAWNAGTPTAPPVPGRTRT